MTENHLEDYKKVLTFFLCTFEKTLTSSFDVSESSCSVRYITMWGVFRIFCWVSLSSCPHGSLIKSLVFDCAFFCLGWVVCFFTAYAFSNVSFTFKKLKRVDFSTRENQLWFSQRICTCTFTQVRTVCIKIILEYGLLDGRDCVFYLYLYLQVLGQYLAHIITNIY